MVALAIQDNPHFSLDSEEMYRSGFTYTYETLRLMKERHPEEEYYFIIGADSLMAFDTWRNPEQICENCVLLAAVRDRMDTASMEQKIDELHRSMGAEIYLLQSPNIDISSTKLRKSYRNHQSIRYFVPERVLDYIRENHIYE